MKILMGIFTLIALSGCNSAKEAYKQGCVEGIFTALESVGIARQQVDPAKVADACDKAEASRKKSE
jgi:hypothetical protein